MSVSASPSVSPHGTVYGAHTFGSFIEAYGHAQDIDGVWLCWREMMSRHIRPRSITIGYVPALDDQVDLMQLKANVKRKRQGRLEPVLGSSSLRTWACRSTSRGCQSTTTTSPTRAARIPPPWS